MFYVRNVAILLSMLLLASCSTVTLTYTPSKQPLRAALVITDEFKRQTIFTNINTACLYADFRAVSVEIVAPKGSLFYQKPKYKGPEVIQNGSVCALNEVGKAAEELSVKGLPHFFEKVDVYNNFKELKNREDYDFIIVPQIEVSTHYDENDAKKRTIKRSYYQGQGYWTASNAIGINATVTYKLHLKDAKDDSTVGIYSGQGASYNENLLDSTKGNRCSQLTVSKLDSNRYDIHLLDHTDYLVGLSYDTVIGEAMSSAFEDLSRDLDSELVSLARVKLEEKSLPSDLVMSATFSDNSGFLTNRTLDAGEVAEISVVVKNTGKGIGFKSTLEVVSDNPKIMTQNNEIPIGDIAAGETKEVKIALKAALDLQDGKASIRLALKEKRGYDAKKVEVSIPTARLERPQLEIVSTEIDDGETGLAKGNGNGIPENGETVELTVFVKNNGEGKAIGVNLSGDKTAASIKWVRDSIHVGTIQPGEVAKAKLAFSIPRNFDAKEIVAGMRVSDTRGVNDAEKKVTLSYVKRAPDIKYAWRVFSRGTQVNTLTNGEAYEVEITLSNRGDIPARDVSLSISPVGSIGLSDRSLRFGEIKAGESASKRVALTVPRTFEERQALLDVDVSQVDFPSIKDTARYAIDARQPKLSYLANLQSRSGVNSLEQGESSILEIQVVNEGSLPANGVKVSVKSRDENLKLAGPNDSLIGVIPANARSETIKIPVSTLRRVKTGEAFLDLNITQEDFSPVASQYAINIVEEGAVVVDVESEEKGRKHPVAKAQSGPAINLKSSQNELTTSDESYSLTFDAEDLRNVEKIIVAVNGIVILNETPGLKRKEILKDIPLKEGENRVTITAYNADNVSSRKEIVITRLAEEDVDTPLITGIREPDAVAVVMGISRYENKDVPHVDYARRDATTVKEYLVRTLGFDAKRIVELYDEGATLDKLNSVFRTKLRNLVVPGKSDVFVFYSGHGVPDVNKKEPYLAPYGLDPADVENTGYVLKDLYEQLAKVDAKSVTVAIDSCFSGSSEGGAIIKDISPVFLDVSNPMLKVKNGVVFTASSSKEVSSWYHKKQHGLFTYFFLQGLRGRADKDNDGQVTVNELEDYVKNNVTEQARQLNRVQTPEVTGAKEKVLVRYK